MDRINLLPDYYVKQRLRNRVDLVCVMLFGLVMAGLLVAEHVSGKETRLTLTSEEAVARRFEAQREKMDELYRLNAQKMALRQQADGVPQAMRLEDPIPRSFLLAEIINACPDSVMLFDINMDRLRIDPNLGNKKKRQTISSDNPNDPKETDKPQAYYLYTVAVKGIASDDEQVGQFYAALNQSPIFRRVSLESTCHEPPRVTSHREFKMTFELRRDVDVLDIFREKWSERTVGADSTPSEAAAAPLWRIVDSARSLLSAGREAHRPAGPAGALGKEAQK
jgi:Tfp pilus assembly protein PilN